MTSRPSISAVCYLAYSKPCLSTAYSTRTASLLSRSTGTNPDSRFFPLCRSFHNSRNLLAEKSHYDVLGVPPAASRADIKKRFYVISKETHPDVNKSDPNAGARFAEVSEAYSILGNEEKRKRYDRDVMPQLNPAPRSPNAGRTGSFAGSRPATGLSKRRGTFRGPPPSFYSQAGSTADPNAEEYARREYESYSAGAQAGQFDPSQFAEAGRWDPTFNPSPIHRTQTVEDKRRQSRKAAEMAAAQVFAEEESAFWARFIVVSGIVGFGVVVGTIINRMSNTPRGGLIRGDGSRRGKERLAAES